MLKKLLPIKSSLFTMAWSDESSEANVFLEDKAPRKSPSYIWMIKLSEKGDQLDEKEAKRERKWKNTLQCQFVN